MKHTPGPWHIFGPKIIYDPDKISDDYAIEFGAGGPGHMIAEVFGRSGESTMHDSLANANLMAAAPEMLEALEYAISYIRSYAPPKLSSDNAAERMASLAHMVEVVAKARGES